MNTIQNLLPTSQDIHTLLLDDNLENIKGKLNDYNSHSPSNYSELISNIINIINPEQICIGGSFTYFEDILYKRLLEKAQLISYQFDKPKIVLAKLKNDAGIIGAIL